MARGRGSVAERDRSDASPTLVRNEARSAGELRLIMGRVPAASIQAASDSGFALLRIRARIVH